MSTTVNSISSKSALDFFAVIGKLKLTKRTGWVNHDIPLPESVSDHMYRMSMLSFAITDSSVNRDRLMKICLVHDLAEATVGDITPYDGISKEQKRSLEETALRKIVGDLGSDEVANEILELWLDYEEGHTIDAEIAKQLDKLEMIIQADEYEISSGKRLDSFFNSTSDSFSHPEVLAWANELRARRDARLLASAI